MDRKILMIMSALVVVAVLVVAFVMIASGGLRRAGGFTTLFDKMQYDGTDTYHQRLSCPTSWDVGDKKSVSDSIVDMSFWKETHGSTSVYWTTMWFVYTGNQWNDPSRGSSFYVPDKSADGWLAVEHGMFSITVSSATNISAKFDIGDVITLETLLVTNNNVVVALGDWVVASTI
jgi:hypothetical protein